jgi:PhoH-like ATPase
VIEVPGVEVFPNEFILLRDETNEKHTGLARVRDGNTLVHLSSQYERAWNIKPRNKEQRMALELLLDPSVQIVTLVGRAGTGKTLLAIAAGLQCVVQYRSYDKILVTRPIMPLGRDIGYLPGAKDEKLIHWMQPIIDNLTFLLRERNGNEESVYPTVQRKVEEMQQKNLLEMEALTYIRGRSIPRQYVIVDEAQNLTPHEVKTIISRAGEGTKMVLTGDPYQIDNPYLDSSSNGLTYTAERLKTEGLHGHMTLMRSERSSLAAVAAALL